LSKLKASAQLLELNALMQAEAGDLSGAALTIEDISALAQSLAQEPIFISQLVRIASEEMALSAVERIMNRQHFGPDELAHLSKRLGVERDDAALRRGWIGERCFVIDLFQMPNAKLESFIMDPGSASGDPTRNGEIGRDWSGYLGFWVMRLSGHLDRDELFFLESTDSYICAIDVSCPERLQISYAVFCLKKKINAYHKEQQRSFIISGM